MPNHCHNRVCISFKKPDKYQELLKIFKSEDTFQQIFPCPDFKNIPAPEDLRNRFNSEEIIAKEGELPVPEEHFDTDGKLAWTTYNWPTSNRQDDRDHDWREEHWGTKWDAYSKGEIEEGEENEYFEIEFSTAWNPATGVCEALRDKYPDDISVSWFYDEPMMQVAGYL